MQFVSSLVGGALDLLAQLVNSACQHLYDLMPIGGGNSDGVDLHRNELLAVVNHELGLDDNRDHAKAPLSHTAVAVIAPPSSTVSR